MTDEQQDSGVIEPQYSAVPQELVTHKWGFLIWLLPVFAISLVPFLVVLFEGINSLRTMAAMGDSAWNLANVAMGIISGLLIGAAGTVAYQKAQGANNG